MGHNHETSTAVVVTPVGPIACHWHGTDDGPLVSRVELAPEHALSCEAPAWLSEAFAAYFDDPLHAIELRVAVSGSEFQRAVWRSISRIPAGTTQTYGALAAQLGSAPRAVGGACRANPVPLLVPCHRVVGRTGLGGFAGDTGGRLREIKRRLLEHEGVLVRA